MREIILLPVPDYASISNAVTAYLASHTLPATLSYDAVAEFLTRKLRYVYSTFTASDKSSRWTFGTVQDSQLIRPQVVMSVSSTGIASIAIHNVSIQFYADSGWPTRVSSLPASSFTANITLYLTEMLESLFGPSNIPDWPTLTQHQIAFLGTTSTTRNGVSALYG